MNFIYMNNALSVKTIIKLLILACFLGNAASVFASKYIKVSNSGFSLPDSAGLGFGPNDWACTYDTDTGLLWEVKTNNGGLRDAAWKYSWYDPSPETNGHTGIGIANGDKSDDCDKDSFCNTHDYQERVNRQGLCGSQDWGIASGIELKTLVLCLEGKPATRIAWNETCETQHRPTIDQDYFPNTASVNEGGYWSDTEKSPATAHMVSFYYSSNKSNHKSFGYFVRLIRRDQLFNVYVDDIAPVVASGQTASHSEHSAITNTLLSVSAADYAGVTDFSIVSGDDNGYFLIDSSGNITLSDFGHAEAANDFEKTPNEFLLTVVARDDVGNEAVGEIVTIKVTNDVTDDQGTPINEAPEFNPEQGYIEGDIYDVCTGKPLPFVELQLTGGQTQQSDENGHYSLQLPNGNYSITARHAGYISASQNQTINSRTYFASFPLNPAVGCASAERASSYKAVIVSGGGPTIGNRPNFIWPATQELANKAYKALKLQGFNDANIYYLSADKTPRDIDGDGQNDIDEEATLANLQYALTQWPGNVEDVVVYLIGHGGQKTIHINRNDKLTAEQLNTWLDNMQTQMTGKQSVILDACYSGSFIPTLAADDRYVLASTSSDLLAVISNVGGSTSFSYYFWDEVVFSGRLGYAFARARQSMSKQLVGQGKTQKASLDTNGDRSETQDDYDQIDQYCFGLCNGRASVAPEISSIAPQGGLNGRLDHILSLTAVSSHVLSKAWATIQRPDYNFPTDDSAINSLQQVSLSCEQNSCQGSYNNFNLNGEYIVTFYVQDSQEQVSLPKSIKLHQSGRDDRDWTASAVYEPATGLLTLKDVEVAGLHYYVELQDHGAYAFSLHYVQPLTGATQTRVAHYDGSRAIIPSVFAFGRYYSIQLLPENGLFQLDFNSIGDSTE